MVMGNVFSAKLKVHQKFDLKGSTVDRQASTKEKVHIIITINSAWLFGAYYILSACSLLAISYCFLSACMCLIGL